MPALRFFNPEAFMPRPLTALVLLLLAGCDLNSFRRTPMYGPDSVAPQLGIDPDVMTETSSGLRYLDVVIGTGTEARNGAEVRVHYTGWLTNGQKFDSSHDRGTPLAFRLGRAEVISGWDEGVAGMRVGGRRKLLIPANLGYGAHAVGPIPPNSVLVFDVELVDASH